jgi:tight adherence protein B
MQLMILAGVFFGTVLIVMALYAFVYRRELAASEAARERLRMGVDANGKPINILRDERASEIPFLNRLLVGRELTHRLGAELSRAGSSRRPGEFFLTSFAAASIGLLIGQRIAPTFALLMAAAGLFVPYLLLKRQQKKRIDKFEQQLPDALDMLVNALKAGYSLQAGMDFVGKESAAPLGPEFARFYDEQRLGVDVRDALVAFQERIDTTDIKMFVTSLLIQRETGGNLAEILTSISNLMRERVAFRGQVATLTAEPKLSARILAGLPFAAIGVLSLLNRDFIRPLLTTDSGHMFLTYAVVSVAIGYVVMMKIADIDI